ncbi:MAG: hypothetical protein KKA84_11920 [Bacteroidetes bacterium]|nr:hypothetical protein [Bacteroidota bacterium]
MNLKEKKPIASYDTDGKYKETYTSSFSAAKILGLDLGNLNKAISKDNKCGGFYWRNITGSAPKTIEVRKYIRSRRAVPVDIYIRPMKLFGTASCIQEAADMTNLTRNSVRVHLRDGTWTNKSATRWRKEALPDYFFKVRP